eukprot:TRINITY_DN37169_c0_g1_i1.p3 TRINITY_DN37169_c0_g1~~TRINITY_DN37169_c0_g1_i1.p3  ORF type:complete len:261 (+),score=32.78 TRINITY_DN37169_c0_g1_i1:61-843(+)
MEAPSELGPAGQVDDPWWSSWSSFWQWVVMGIVVVAALTSCTLLYRARRRSRHGSAMYSGASVAREGSRERLDPDACSPEEPAAGESIALVEEQPRGAEPRGAEQPRGAVRAAVGRGRARAAPSLPLQEARPAAAPTPPRPPPLPKGRARRFSGLVPEPAAPPAPPPPGASGPQPKGGVNTPLIGPEARRRAAQRRYRARTLPPGALGAAEPASRTRPLTPTRAPQMARSLGAAERMERFGISPWNRGKGRGAVVERGTL